MRSDGVALSAEIGLPHTYTGKLHSKRRRTSLGYASNVFSLQKNAKLPTNACTDNSRSLTLCKAGSADAFIGRQQRLRPVCRPDSRHVDRPRTSAN